MPACCLGPAGLIEVISPSIPSPGAVCAPSGRGVSGGPSALAGKFHLEASLALLPRLCWGKNSFRIDAE